MSARSFGRHDGRALRRRRNRAEQHRALDEVPQLAHVPGQAPLRRPSRGTPAADPSCPPSERWKCAASSGMSSRRDAQRRQRDLDDREPVVEVFAERALVHVARERRGWSRRRCARRPGALAFAADAAHRARLERAQQLGLQPSGSSPISSRNSVPPSASSKTPLAIGVGAGERAAHVTEQLALDEVLRHRAAVDRRRTGARAARRCVDASARPAPCRCRSRPGRGPSSRPRDALEHRVDAAHLEACANELAELLFRGDLDERGLVARPRRGSSCCRCGAPRPRAPRRRGCGRLRKTFRSCSRRRARGWWTASRGARNARGMPCDW